VRRCNPAQRRGNFAAVAATRRFSRADEKRAANSRARNSIPDHASVRFGDGEGRRGTGRHRSTIQYFTRARSAEAKRAATADCLTHTDSRGTRWETKDEQKPRQLRRVK